MVYFGFSFLILAKLAVPRANKLTQPKTDIPIWGNGKIQVLQHRNYGAERYMRLLAGWELEGFVVHGKDVNQRKSHETKMGTMARMLQCSFETNEGQPLLILRKLGNVTFDTILTEGKWTSDKTEFIEKEYHNQSKSFLART